MFIYTTGNLLESNATALVNTVNCEGYMGKGIAYQFKLRYPGNNADYIKACKSGKLSPGKLHYYVEDEKTIINFPTKNKWREKSKIEYIQTGLDELKKLIITLNLKSIAIPPLGSGNGGLCWLDVKPIIEQKLYSLSTTVDFYIYEPSKHYSTTPSVEPNLSISALVLMEIKHNLKKFNRLRLQKCAYFVNIFSGKKYFNFVPYKYGPYDHSIDIISKKIKEFQEFHNTSNTDEAKAILYNKIVSEKVDNTISELSPAIIQACNFVNSISSDHVLECVSTICFLIEQNNVISEADIILGFKSWSDEKAKKFSIEDISYCIKELYSYGLIEKNLIGYQIAV